MVAVAGNEEADDNGTDAATVSCGGRDKKSGRALWLR